MLLKIEAQPGRDNKNTIKTFAEKPKKEHELSAVDLQPSTDKNGMQDIKIYAKKRLHKNNKRTKEVKMC